MATSFLIRRVTINGISDMRAEPVSWFGHLLFNIRQRFGIDQGPGVMGLVRRPSGKQLEVTTDRAKWFAD